MKRLIVITCLAIILLPLQAQNFTKIKFDRHLSGLKSSQGGIYAVQIDTPATGMVVGIDNADNYEGSYIVIKGDTTMLVADEENEGNVDQKFSNLISFNSQVDSFLFYPAGINQEISFYFIDARMKAGNKKQAENKKKSAGCSVPGMIEQSVWREGLPSPEYDRINQKVLHVIIHHTAGSNSDTNYTEVVRNIYVYHTQIREWSDIGYNYLIAPNGNIYKGRDPGTFDQDNVMGAHFCNSNSGTMGISMMGTFTDIVPTDTAFQSLIALITWKMGKEQLNPLGAYYHALNSELPAIAGHRDGCSTECPGNAMYPLLDSIRNEVKKDFDACGYSITSIIQAVSGPQKLKISYNREKIIIQAVDAEIEFAVMYDMLGRKIPMIIDLESLGTLSLSVNPSSKGIFILVCKTKENYYSEKIFINN